MLGRAGRGRRARRRAFRSRRAGWPAAAECCPATVTASTRGGRCADPSTAERWLAEIGDDFSRQHAGRRADSPREHNRFDVYSADGIDCGLGRGHWPGVLMVHGSIADHTTFEPFVAVLRELFTTYCMDRRGFGASGDTPGYTSTRLRRRRRGRRRRRRPHSDSGALWGHSYGANCAMGGAARHATCATSSSTNRASACRYPPGSIPPIEAALDRGTPTPPSSPSSSTSRR